MMKKINLLALSISVMVAGSYAYAGQDYEQSLGAANEKVKELMEKRLASESKSQKSQDNFTSVLNSKNANKDSHNNSERGYARPVWLERTKDDQRNIDPIAMDWGGRDLFEEKREFTKRSDTNNTDFYKNKMTTSGAVAYYNNNLIPITDGYEMLPKPPRDMRVWINYSGQARAYPKPKGNCDAYGSAITGLSGGLYVKAQSAINVVKTGVSSQLKFTISSFDNSSVLATYSSPIKKAVGYPNKPLAPKYFMYNSASNTFTLGKANMPVNVCVEIVNYETQPNSIRHDNFNLYPEEIAAVNAFTDEWRNHQNAVTDSMKGSPSFKDFYKQEIKLSADTWLKQYRDWVRPLATKYVDMMWLGL